MKRKSIKALVLGLTLTSGHVLSSVSLDTYLQEVTGQNSRITATQNNMASAELQRSQAKILTSIYAFSLVQLESDRKQPQFADFEGISRERRTFQLGLEQNSSYGMTHRLFSNYSYINQKEATFIPNPRVANSALVYEFTFPLMRNFLGKNTQYQQEIISKRSTAEMYRESFDQRRVINEAQAAYWRLKTAQEIVRSQEEIIEQGVKFLKWTQGRVRDRLSEESDLRQAQAILDLRRFDLQKEKMELLKAQQAFNSIRQLDLYTEVGELEDFPSNDLLPKLPSEEEALKRPDLLGLEAQLQKENILKDLNSTMKPGKPEMVVRVDQDKAQKFGVSESLVGNEIRGRIEGIESARFREDGREYDIRVKIKDGSEDFLNKINKILVPNINLLPVQLSDFANVVQTDGDNKLLRTNRSASMKISANLPDGVGLGEVMERTKAIYKDLNIPPTVRYIFEGEAESFEDMGNSMFMTFGFGVLLIYLVLASLYESFLVPMIVMSALPLAIGGAFVSLLIAGQGLDMYSIIGMLLLMGVATKNSILLVDTVMEKIREEEGKELHLLELVAESSVRRLRPILMTSLALIAGMVPIAIGLNEASAQRTSLGNAVIGGTISSTALTLILVPAILMLFKKRIVKTSFSSAHRVKAVDIF